MVFVMLVYIQVHVILVFPLPLTAADGPLCACSSHGCYSIICSAVCNNFSLTVCHNTQTTMAYPGKSSRTSDCDRDRDPASLRAHDVHEK